MNGNQPTLHAAIQKTFESLSGKQPWHEHSERSHGRGVSQLAWVAPAINRLRLDTTCKAKTRLRQKRKLAAWDDDTRANILGIQPL